MPFSINAIIEASDEKSQSVTSPVPLTVAAAWIAELKGVEISIDDIQAVNLLKYDL